MADKLVDYVLGKAHSYLSLEEKIDNLERSINVLKNRAADVKVSVEEAKLSSGKKRKREVEEWLKEVEKKIEEFDKLKVDFHSSKFCLRIPLADCADKMITKVVELTQQGEFSGGILLDVHEKKGLPLVAVKGKGRAFDENLKEIWKWIMNDEISSIGIYGMGGVGKTTLATHSQQSLE